MSDNLLPLLSDAVKELLEPRRHREPVSQHDGEKWTTTGHVTDVPGLLTQLRRAVEPSSSAEGGKSSFGSRPSARLDAIDTLRRIEDGTLAWLRRYGEQPRGSLEANLRALVGLAPDLEPPIRWDLTKRVTGWVIAARITTGWEVPPFRPNNTCPLCDVKGSLRIRLGDGITSYESSATCVDCGGTWDSTQIGLLAEHIRAENNDEEQA